MENTTQPQPEKAPELTVKDLVNIKVIVDTAVRRGTFAAEELSAVGAAYDKLNTFLSAVQASAPAEQTEK
jgi:chromosome condensin MukBEF complex kleisin-like MukF subunit